MSEADLAVLAAEVRSLRDRADIRDCMNRYTRGADLLDRDLLLSACHADATDDRRAFTGGPEARVLAHREAVMDFNVTSPTGALPPHVLRGARDASDRSRARPLALSAEGAARMRAGLTAPRD